MERIVFLERNTFRVDFRTPVFSHDWIDHGESRPDQVIERLSGATIAIVNKLPLRERQLKQLPQLKLIAVAATGVDNIDLDYCRTNGIAVCNARNYASNSLPEHVLMLILALRRNLLAYRHDVRVGKWAKAKQFCLLDHQITDIHGSKLGIVGYGFLGQAVAKIGRAAGMELLIAERKDTQLIRNGRVPFETVLADSDVLSLHCPLNQTTSDLIAAPELRTMKSTALLINTARGGLVNDADLVRALSEGWIAGAGIDVLDQEPPLTDTSLLQIDLPNLIVTPHVAWASEQAMRTLADQLVDAIEAFVRGEPLNRVV